MAKAAIKKVGFFYREDNKQALVWSKKIETWMKSRFPRVKIVEKSYDAVIVLGGDGTILEAARECLDNKALIVGLNLGTVGFLASARRPPQFLPTLDKLFRGRYEVAERSVITANVVRNNRKVFTTTALNEVVILNPLGMVSLKVHINGKDFQTISGTGVMVATSTGSTAYNISAHGPVVMPSSHSFILTEILDHNIPTPSLVLSDDYEIDLRVTNFRKRGLLSISETGQEFDVLFIADGEVIFPLQTRDIVKMKRATTPVRFAEFEPNYFLKSLQEKFAFN